MTLPPHLQAKAEAAAEAFAKENYPTMPAHMLKAVQEVISKSHLAGAAWLFEHLSKSAPELPRVSDTIVMGMLQQMAAQVEALRVERAALRSQIEDYRKNATATALTEERKKVAELLAEVERLREFMLNLSKSCSDYSTVKLIEARLK